MVLSSDSTGIGVLVLLAVHQFRIGLGRGEVEPDPPLTRGGGGLCEPGSVRRQRWVNGGPCRGCLVRALCCSGDWPQVDVPVNCPRCIT